MIAGVEAKESKVHFPWNSLGVPYRSPAHLSWEG
jgi:hypothetical protein